MTSNVCETSCIRCRWRDNNNIFHSFLQLNERRTGKTVVVLCELFSSTSRWSAAIDCFQWNELDYFCLLSVKESDMRRCEALMLCTQSTDMEGDREKDISMSRRRQFYHSFRALCLVNFSEDLQLTSASFIPSVELETQSPSAHSQDMVYLWLSIDTNKNFVTAIKSDINVDEESYWCSMYSYLFSYFFWLFRDFLWFSHRRHFPERIPWHVSNDRTRRIVDRFLSLTQLGKIDWLCDVAWKKASYFSSSFSVRHLANTIGISGYQFWKERFRELIDMRRTAACHRLTAV